MNPPRKSWRGLMAGALLRLTPVSTRPEKHRLARLDFSANARRLGIHMNERIRSAWRRQWLRLRPADFEKTAATLISKDPNKTEER